MFAVSAAVVEVLTNAVEHAYPPDRPGSVQLRAHLGADGTLECQVTDQGTWRPPDTGPTHRGRGLMMARQLVDELHMAHPADGGTVVGLRHRLRRSAMIASEAHPEPARSTPETPFAIQAEADGAGRVLRVNGAVDLTTVDDLERTMTEISRGGVVPVIVDLTAVTQLASVGVRALHELRDRLADQGHDLILVAPATSPAHLVLDIVHLPHRGEAAPTSAEEPSR